MMFLKSIGLWILKMILGGIFKNIQNKEAEKANKERDAALAGVESIDEAKKTEDTLRTKMDDAEKAFKAKPAPDDDPFNLKAWNKGEI